MNEVDLKAVREDHVFDPEWNLDECKVDEETLPCTTLRLATEVEQLRAENKRLREQIEAERLDHLAAMELHDD